MAAPPCCAFMLDIHRNAEATDHGLLMAAPLDNCSLLPTASQSASWVHGEVERESSHSLEQSAPALITRIVDLVNLLSVGAGCPKPLDFRPIASRALGQMLGSRNIGTGKTKHVAGSL